MRRRISGGSPWAARSMSNRRPMRSSASFASGRGFAFIDPHGDQA